MRTALIHIFTIIILFLAVSLTRGDTSYSKSHIELDVTFGGKEKETGNSIQETSDGGYLLLGETNSYGNGENDMYLVRVDSGGKELWSKTYGGEMDELGYSIQQTKDNGYLLLGCTESYGAGKGDMYLVRIDAGGKELWSKTYGGEKRDVGVSIQRALDGGYLLLGCTESYGSGEGDIYIIKIDENGSKTWEKTLGTNKDEVCASVKQTIDGGYIILGYQYQGISVRGVLFAVYLVKVDKNGDKQWEKTFEGENLNLGHYIQQVADGGYIVLGNTTLSSKGVNIFLKKLDEHGKELWEKDSDFGVNFGLSIQQTKDYGYLIFGYKLSNGFPVNVDNSDRNQSHDSYVLVKTDEDGNKQWENTIGSCSFEMPRFVQKTKDGGYVILATTNITNNSTSDIHLIKIKIK